MGLYNRLMKVKWSDTVSVVNNTVFVVDKPKYRFV